MVCVRLPHRLVQAVEALHSTEYSLLVCPPLSVNAAGLGDGFRCVSNVKTSFALPPWLTLTTWTLLYVAWAACAESARPSHATPTAATSRVARVARMVMWNIETPQQARRSPPPDDHPNPGTSMPRSTVN